MRIVRNGKGKGDKDKGGGGGKGAPLPGKPARLGAPALLAVLALMAAPAASVRVQAQTQLPAYDVLISLSGDDVLASGPVRDQDLVLQAPGAPAKLAWPSETFSWLAGDGGTGKWPVFTDIDAVADLGGATADEGLYISLGSDEAGFKDGDVLRCGPGGLSVWMSEADFMGATGCTDGNIDLDALQIDADGTLIFSFADNEASSFLSGDGSGSIKDGDVLSWVPTSANAQIVYTETQINALVKHALASTTAVSTTDTTAVARDPSTGALLFAVQSPTAEDATVFSEADGGSVVAGHAEKDLGFTVGPEIDALSVAVSHFPVATVSSGKVPAGAPLSVSLSGGKPGIPHFVLASLTLDGLGKPALEGWGRFVLHGDAVLVATWLSGPVIVPDATGGGTLTTVLPAGLPATDIVVQIVAPPLGGLATGSNPVLIELSQ
jgi:hypothetical protein